MKKVLFGAIVLLLGGCYTPMNNSGVATTKPWIEIPAKRVDFEGKQYDSCVQFKLRFWPQEAAERVDLQHSCITACCWRSEQDEIVLDFNKNFERELREYGRARKYSPAKITLKVTHSNLVNVTRVAVSPKGSIKNSGLIKLSYQVVDDPARLAQIEEELALKEEEPPVAVRVPQKEPPTPQDITQKTPKTAPATRVGVPPGARAKKLVQQSMGARIDEYFYQMNKTYQQTGAVFVLSARYLEPTRQEDGSYLVKCYAKARSGIDQAHLNTSTFACGVWLVDEDAGLVFPHDKKAKQIAQK